MSLLFSCNSSQQLGKRTIEWPQRKGSVAGSEFYKKAAAMNWAQRDSFVVKEVLKGNIPDFLKQFKPISVSIMDPETGKKINANYFVAPDYLSVGTNDDWARVNISPKAAQKIADDFDCFLPTKKMVDDIYKSATVKLEPIPMYAFRDSTPTMWQHHLIIEGQRKGKKGLIAGIKKDVVITEKIVMDKRPDRVAIYGWHQLNGQPIQPLYTGHIYWWVDYSQGIRLVYRNIQVDGKWIDYIDVLKNKTLQRLLCDEGDCNFYRYDY